jgi:anti-sigma regulatory factor (Ser/Thr protein kinase)
MNQIDRKARNHQLPISQWLTLETQPVHSVLFGNAKSRLTHGWSNSRRGIDGSGYHGRVAAVKPLRMELDHSYDAPRNARVALQSWLGDVDCADPVPDDALLMVSELVTNVVRHTGSDPMIVATFDDHRLRIEVHDSDPGAPVPVAPSADGGFGLSILDNLCDMWGWEPTHSGKRVWAETLC